MDRTRTTHPTAARRGSGATAAVTATTSDALRRAEHHLHLVTRGRERATLDRWRTGCAELAGAPVSAPSQVQGWLRRAPTRLADRVLGELVRHAQRGDSAALLTAIICLGPGLRALTARTGVTVDEAVSEIAMGILSYPVDRRSSVAGGLLLDARNRIHRAGLRSRRTDPLTDDETAHPVAGGELGTTVPPAQRIVQLVCDAHREGLLDRTEARLILDTRLGGHKVKPVADILGLSPSAAYQRRSRAEARLAHVA
jgi:DNA-directed RNA polymerase specialized sigma24 family protein